jgi:bifunctional non-homologous end joining protein LigD
MKMTLRYQSGTSDKEYHVQLEPKGHGYVVNFQYGRRGSALTCGTKTPLEVTRAQAQDIFNRLVKEKVAKGYKMDEQPAAAPVGETAKEVDAEMLPQLLTDISEEDAEQYINDDAYCAQEKLDGRNKTLRLKNMVVTSANKKGQIVPTPGPVHDQAIMAKRDFIASAEHIGDVYHVHNLTSWAGLDGQDITSEPYSHRLAKAINLFPWTDTPVRVVPTAFTKEEKRKMFNDLKHGGKEGIVFKRRDAAFQVGYTDTQFKCKFWKSLSARVRTLRPGGALSIECELFNGNAWVSCGNVTVLKRGLIETLKVGDVVEIKYLYALKATGVLYQPSPCMTGETFKRDDVDAMECITRQLKYKAEVS